MILSVIIPAYNEQNYLPETIQMLKTAFNNLYLIDFKWEIIVCDNNSTDQTAKVAHQSGAKVVFEPENQISRARNTGAKSAVGKWLLFLDADTYPDQKLTSEILEIIHEDKIIGCGVTVSVKDGSLFNKLRMERLNPLFRILKLSGGAFLLCRKDAFEAINGFSQGLYAYEEFDFIIRLKKYGKSIKKDFKVLYKNPVITSGRKGNSNLKSIFKVIVSNTTAILLFLFYYIFPFKVIQKMGKKLLSFWYANNRS